MATITVGRSLAHGLETLSWQQIRPWHVMTAGIAIAVVAWGLVIAVDLMNLAGTRDRLASTSLEQPMIWFHLFNSGPIEFLQWLAMIGVIVLAALLAGMLSQMGIPGASRFWIVLAIGVGLLLFEDAGNVRHMTLDKVFGDSTEVGRSAARNVIEVGYLGVIAGVPVLALLAYGRSVWHAGTTRYYLIAAFAIYGFVGIAHAVSRVGDVYVAIGSFFNRTFANGQMQLLDIWWGADGQSAAEQRDATYALFVDGVLEEGLELIAVTAFLAAAVAFFAYLRKERETPGGPPSAGATPDEKTKPSEQVPPAESPGELRQAPP